MRYGAGVLPMRARVADVSQRGRLTWIGVRPAHGAPMVVLAEAAAIADRGLDGDRTAAGAGGGRRQVTLVQGEHLPVVAGFVGVAAIDPTQVRRNLVVTGINLAALHGLRVAIGDEVIVVPTGPCAPCRKLDALIGPGGFQAMRGHGGVTARIERGGRLRLGDVVHVLGVAGP